MSLHETSLRFRIKTIGFSIFLFSSFQWAFAQQTKNDDFPSVHGKQLDEFKADKAHSRNDHWQLHFYMGKVLKHTPKILFPTDGMAWGMDIHWYIKTDGKKEWHHKQRFPDLGLSISYLNLGNNDILGSSIGLMGIVRVPINRNRLWESHAVVGTGLAWISKVFDPLDNPLNTAMGSELNNITTVQWSNTFKLNKRFRIKGNIHLHHLSNGFVRLPNLGINIVGFGLGMNYRWNEVHSSPKTVSSGSIWKRTFGINLNSAMAIKEHAALNGRRTLIHAVSASAYYHILPYNRVYIGLDFEHDQGISLIAQDQMGLSLEESRKGAKRYMLFLADEIILGRLGVWLQGGIYLPSESILRESIPFNRVGLKYYPRLDINTKNNCFPFLGVFLKSHAGSAEYVSWSLGIIW